MHYARLTHIGEASLLRQKLAVTNVLNSQKFLRFLKLALQIF